MYVRTESEREGETLFLNAGELSCVINRYRGRKSAVPKLGQRVHTENVSNLLIVQID